MRYPILELTPVRSAHLKVMTQRNDSIARQHVKGGVNLNANFPPLDMALMEISRSRFKQSKNSMLIPYVVGCFVNFRVIFGYIWEEIVFLEGLVKLREIRNIED